MKTVLLLDDSPAFQRVVKLALLEVKEIRLLSATNENEALKLISENTVDAIIAYSHFLANETLNLLKKMKNHASNVLIIAEQESDLKEFNQAGFNQALRKPLQGVELRRKVEQLLNLSGESESAKPVPPAFSPPPPPSIPKATPAASPKVVVKPEVKSAPSFENTPKEVSKVTPKNDLPRLTIDVTALKRSQDELSVRGESGKATDELLLKLEKELRGKINEWLEKKMPNLIKETIQEEINKVLN